jgi:hypothetical protein
VKTERRALLVKITANFNEERNVSVSKRTVRRRLRDHGFSTSVCRKKVVVKFNNKKKPINMVYGKNVVDNSAAME